jgi:hypothetical protein
MAMKWLPFALLVSAALAQTQPPAPAEQDRFEKAHEGIFGAKPEKGKDASRLSDMVSGDPRNNGTPQQNIVRRNFIDGLIFGRMEKDHVPHAALSTDEEFVRRVYVDATGAIPSVEAVRSFVADRDPAKRDKLIDSLVASDAFADEWAWYWGDLMRANQDFFHFYNRQWLKADRPYNDVFADIVTMGAKEGHSIPASGFFHGADYNAARAMSPTDPDNYYLMNRLDFIDEASIDISRIFLGVNTDCISCHNGAGHLNSINLYLSRKTRTDFAREAAFLGRMRVIIGWSDRVLNVADENTIYDDLGPGYNTGQDAPFYAPAENRFPRNGKTYTPAFLLTGEEPNPQENPRRALARILPSNIQFARAAVNLVWSRLMVVGFVEPYDGFDLDRLDPKNPPPAPWTIQPTNPELLEAMAKDFQANNFSIQHVIKAILKSSAYQLSTRFDAEWKDSYIPYYPRRFSRVLSGPEAADAIAAATDSPFHFSSRGEAARKILELATPADVRSSGRGPGAEGVVVSALMQSFFQNNRQTPATFGNQASSVQAMLMMSSPVVTKRIADLKGTRIGTLLASGKSNPEIVEELFLATLARNPTAGEVKACEHLISAYGKTGFEDIQWALLNSPEFLVNH